MIYLNYSYDRDFGYSVKNVWNVDVENVEERYIEFMHEHAKSVDIVINPHWLNMMDWKNHHPQLSFEEYKQKKKQWNKILNLWSIDNFISDVLKGKKEDYVSINKF